MTGTPVGENQILFDVPTFKFALTDEVISASKDQDPHLFLPTQAEPLASGWDVRCASANGIELKPGCYIKVPLGFRVFSPPGWWLRLVPRSSTFIKKHIHALYGTIDEAYEGQVFFCGQYLPDAELIINCNRLKKIEFGDRIGQIIPARRENMTVEVVSNDNFAKLSVKRDSARKSGGLGSSGDK
jgi:dUTPase